MKHRLKLLALLLLCCGLVHAPLQAKSDSKPGDGSGMGGTGLIEDEGSGLGGTGRRPDAEHSVPERVDMPERIERPAIDIDRPEVDSGVTGGDVRPATPDNN